MRRMHGYMRALPWLLVSLGALGQTRESVSIQELVLRALEGDLDLKIERVEPSIAHEGMREAEAEFDPTLHFATQRVDTRRFINNLLETDPSLSGGKLHETRYELQEDFGAKLQTGAQYSFSLVTPFTETNNPVRLFDRTYMPSISLQFSQPLARDRGHSINRVRIAQAGLRETQTRLGVTKEMLGLIRDVETTYWTLVCARRRLDLAKADVGIQERRIERFQYMTTAGIVSDQKVRAAQVSAETRRADVIQAESDVEQARLRIHELLGEALQGRREIDTITPLPEEPPPEDLNSLVQAALDRRPELGVQQMTIDALEMEERLALNERRPRVDTVAGMSYGGLAGSDPVSRPLFPLPPDLAERDRYQDAFNDGAFSWSVGLRLSIPIGNQAALSRLQTIKLRLDQERIRLRQIKNGIGAEVESAFHEARSAWARLESARKLVGLAREGLTDTESKLQAGLSTEFDILEAKEGLSEAESRENQSHLAYVIELSRMRAATVASFDVYDLQIESGPGSPPLGTR